MKQNKHQLEHLPTLLVQQIRLQWYKGLSLIHI